MREIKFRAWEENNGMLYLEDMLIGCGRETASSWSIIDIHGKLVTKMPNFHEDPKPNSSLLEWMQYTGLKDKNGVEIYEGDIVRPLEHSNYVVKWYNEESGGVSTYGYYMEVTGMPDVVASINPIQAKNLEVIGNIYENPELLKETT